MSPSLQLDPGYYRKNALTPSNPLFTPRERPSLALALGRPPPRSTVPTDLIDDDIDSLLELYLHTPTTPTSSSFPISPVTDDFGDARNLDGFLFDIPELEVDDEDVDFEPPVTFSLTIPENSLLDGEFSLEESLIGDGVKGGAAHGVWGISNKRRRRVWLKHRKTPAHSLATLGFNPRF